ncbi:MAG: hypothetical protein ACRDK7_08405 [Solirubrobacteraceae bacterium]
MSRPWQKQWPRVGTTGKKSYQVGFYDHERVERTKTFPSASLAREWMRAYSAAERRGMDSLRRSYWILTLRRPTPSTARARGGRRAVFRSGRRPGA